MSLNKNRLSFLMTILVAMAFHPAGSQDFDDATEDLLDNLRSKGESEEELLGFEGKLQDIPSVPIMIDAPYVADFPVDESIYIVGPGDYFEIYTEDELTVKQVNPEGNLVFTNTGVVHVADLTLEKAKALILKNVQSSRIKARCYVNLHRPKSMYVFATGAIGVPGIYQVPGNWRVSELLIKAKWFRTEARIGVVYLISKNGDTTKLDMGKFLIENDLNQNPYLTQGANVYIPFIDYSRDYVTVQLGGASTVDIQLEGGETISDLMVKFNLYKPQKPVELLLLKEKDGEIKFMYRHQFMDYQPRPGAVLQIRGLDGMIFVSGAVAKPGMIVYNPTHTAINYISEAGILPSTSIKRKIEVIKKDGTKTKVLLNSASLQPGDMLIARENLEKKILTYTPLLLSIVSITIATLTLIK